MGRHKLALTYINRALYLTRIVSGANHPDTASIYVHCLYGMNLPLPSDQHRHHVTGDATTQSGFALPIRGAEMLRVVLGAQ